MSRPAPGAASNSESSVWVADPVRQANPLAAYHNRTVLVTGGFGFIGSNLVPRLVELGADVRLLARSWPPENDSAGTGVRRKVRFFKGDIRDEAVVRRAVVGCDFVFHLAGKSGSATSNESPLEDLDVNCRGLLILLNSVRLLAPKAVVVFPSSRLVYAPNLPMPVTEHAETSPISIYGAHKLASESYLHIFGRLYGTRSVVLRITNPYGPFQRPEQTNYGVINQFIHRAVRGETISLFGTGDQLRDYIHIDDVVRALLLVAMSPAAANGTFNVGCGYGTSLAELANLVVDLAGGGRVEHVPWPEAEARVETGPFYADTTRLEDATGWVPRVGLADGVRSVMSRLRPAAGVRTTPFVAAGKGL